MPGCPLVFVDVETTSAGPDREAWEIGMIRRDGDPRGQVETSMFVDVSLADADPRALAIGRFYDRHPLGRSLAGIGPRAPLDLTSGYHAAMTVASFTHGAVLIGCTVSFDAETLEPLLRQHRIVPGWDYHLLDATTFAAGYLRGIAHARSNAAENIRPPFKSRDVAGILGIVQPAEEAHTALGDARLAMQLYDAVAGE